MDSTYVIWFLTFITLLTFPLVFIAIRQTTKKHRQEVVKDLAAVFSLPKGEVSRPDEDLIPSFEFVKYKYFFERSGKNKNEDPKDFSPISWAIGTVPLIITLAIISFFASAIINYYVESVIDGDSIKFVADHASDTNTNKNPVPLWYYGLIAAFAGGYIYMIRAFFQAINNFDFSPAAFVGAANNLLVGGILGAIFAVAFGILSRTTIGENSINTYITVFVGFVIGYFPNSAVKSVLFRSKMGFFKNEDSAIFDNMKITPVEIIDGIDTEIRDRLADHHITSTQNLAAANPLMLFVETPYGVYQIMDWVAQAQLCCSVGPEKLVHLWRLGIRTLFDLERAALDPECKNANMLTAIGKIILAGDDEDDIMKPLREDPTSSSDMIEKMVISNIQVRLDDPHVHRLRQIYIKIGNRLGPTNRRFIRSG